MQWLLSLAFIVAAAILIPWAMASFKRPRRKRGVGASVAAGIGGALTALLDPAQAAAIVRIEKQQERGDVELGESGDLLD